MANFVEQKCVGQGNDSGCIGDHERHFSNDVESACRRRLGEATKKNDTDLFVGHGRDADGAQNPPEYAGAETAAQQKEAFPDLETLQLQRPRDEVYTAAEAAARSMGWEIVSADEALGRIEATETTTWFRFRDDVVIRVSASGDTTAASSSNKLSTRT